MPPANIARTVRTRFGMVCTSHGRAGDFARRTDDFSNFKNNNVRRGQDPALQIVVYGRFPRKPRAMAHPCREAYMPPLQTPGAAYTNQKRCHGANGRGGVSPAGAFRSATGPQDPALSAQIKPPPCRTGEKRPVPRQNLHIHAGTRPGGAAPGQNRQKTAQIAAAFVRFTPCLLAEMLYNIQHRMNKYSNRACRGRRAAKTGEPGPHTKTQRKRNGS